jgi:antitoxin component of MazEF toxin-antitoxin module
MRKRLSRIGSSRGIILDKTLRELLGIEDDGEVCLTVEGRRLIIQAVYGDAIEEMRARVPRDQRWGVGDRRVREALRRVRSGLLRARGEQRTGKPRC